jgi:tRNA nucleotidyltransferase (CCA-adding enzyme)
MSPTIQLATDEARLTSLLREAHEKEQFSDSKVEIRYAGGWVRDKLVGKPSHDIDIAVSTLSGHDFAMQFAQFLDKAYPQLETGTIAKIQKNPEKSKHLDTATARFLNLELDFVQLRTESYADSGDSRTPSVTEVGTLLEDAERRDCTMNALYYNVHTSEVEDPTGRGLTDLKRGIIQTPLAPRQTFLDDPLRVLRCVRFASQFGFEIEKKTWLCMAEAEVHQALERKVVRERIGIEVLKMLRGIDPARALRTLQSQGLYEIVFAPLPKDVPTASLDVLEQAMTVVRDEPGLMQHYEAYLDGRLWMAIALLPYRDVRMPKDKRGHQDPLACGIVRDRLKLTNSLELLFRQLYPARTTSDKSENSTRLQLGKLVRKLGKDWKLVLLIETLSSPDARSPADLQRLIARIAEEKLDDAHAWKNAIDGKKIRPLLLSANKDIKLMSALTELAVEYRIEDISITEQEILTRLQEHIASLPA